MTTPEDVILTFASKMRELPQDKPFMVFCGIIINDRDSGPISTASAGWKDMGSLERAGAFALIHELVASAESDTNPSTNDSHMERL